LTEELGCKTQEEIYQDTRGYTIKSYLPSTPCIYWLLSGYLLTNLPTASSGFYWPAFRKPPWRVKGPRSHAYL